MSKGFTDKIYWRAPWGSVWHAFKKMSSKDEDGMRYVSLCERMYIPRSGGQDCRRPYPLLRCARCDILEMERRGWEESGPESKSFLELHAGEFLGARP